ncbi:MAG: CDGSH iron-sulfur domain-containing protein [Chloroflexota bacterium]
MVPESGDIQVRSQLIAMSERCPSGTYSYSLEPDGEVIEPDLPQEISVVDEGVVAGPLWVSGGIPIERADGQPVETRNRMTLCRCGHSDNKPFCDGTHHEIGFVG